MAIVASPVPAAFQHRPVKQVRLQALFPPGHQLSLLRTARRAARVKPEVVYESSVSQTLAALAEAGLGIATMGDSVDLRGFDLHRRYVCDHQGRLLHFHLHVAWLRERTLPRIAYKFAEDLAEYMSAENDEA